MITEAMIQSLITKLSTNSKDLTVSTYMDTSNFVSFTLKTGKEKEIYGCLELNSFPPYEDAYYVAFNSLRVKISKDSYERLRSLLKEAHYKYLDNIEKELAFYIYD